METKDLKIADIKLLVELLRVGSVRQLARSEGLLPGQISKQIQRLERALGSQLIERSTSGVRPSARAQELLPQLEKILQGVEELNLATVQNFSSSSYFTIATSSFLATYLLPFFLKRIPTDGKLRVLEIPPSHTVSAGAKASFDYCLHSSELAWPATWTTEQVGSMRWALFARTNHPLSQLDKVSLRDIKKYPFTVPIYWSIDGTQFGKDLCPIDLHKRVRGHEVSTAATAMELISRSDQLSFLPVMATKEKRDRLVEIKAPWPVVKSPVCLSVRSSLVRQSVFREMQESFAEALR